MTTKVSTQPRAEANGGLVNSRVRAGPAPRASALSLRARSLSRWCPDLWGVPPDSGTRAAAFGGANTPTAIRRRVWTAGSCLLVVARASWGGMARWRVDVALQGKGSIQSVGDFTKASIGAGLVLVAARRATDTFGADRFVVNLDRQAATATSCLSYSGGLNAPGAATFASSPDETRRMAAVYALRRLRLQVRALAPSPTRRSLRSPARSNMATEALYPCVLHDANADCAASTATAAGRILKVSVGSGSAVQR
jgi:hypothetical protein